MRGRQGRFIQSLGRTGEVWDCGHCSQGNKAVTWRDGHRQMKGERGASPRPQFATVAPCSGGGGGTGRGGRDPTGKMPGSMRHSQALGPSVDWPGNQRSRSWERNSRNALGQATALFQDTAVTVGKLAWESLYSCRTLTFITGRCTLLFHQPATRPAGQGMAIQNLSLSYSIPRAPMGAS